MKKQRFNIKIYLNSTKIFDLNLFHLKSLKNLKQISQYYVNSINDKLLIDIKKL